MPLFNPQLSTGQVQSDDTSQAQPQPQAQSPTPQNQAQAPAVPSSVQQAQQAQVADVTHHALFGKAVKSMVHAINGTQSSYQTDPRTGEISETTVSAKPGALFRALLAGALIGGAAGSEGRGQGGFLGGVARGGTANIQDQRQQDQARFQRAQEQQKSQMEREKLTDEEMQHKAMTAHENMQTAALLHSMHLSDEKTVEEHNAAARAYEKTLIDAGAVPAQLSINGKTVDTTDGNSFVAAFTKDPSIAHAPDGFERHFVSTSNLGVSELHYDGEHWVDDSGNPVNVGNNISIRAYDLSATSFKKPISRTGAEINAARRQKIVDPKGTYMVSPEGMSAIYTLGAKDANEDARTAASNARATKAAKNNKTFIAIESKKAAALAKAENTYWTARNKSADPQTPNPALEAQLNESKQQAQNSYEEDIKAAGGNPQHFEYGAVPHAAPQSNPANPPVKVNQTVTLKNGQQVTVTKVNPNGTFEYR
jgi:hypothetical protein